MVPQVPQLLGLLRVSTHIPWQRVCPPGQTQRPALHVVPPVHTTPQAPQFSGSVAVTTQLRPQSRSPGAQLALHCESVQTCVEAHSMPHPPQL
jgi:hypothetical protein